VLAVDACAHHADVTNKRALRIQKHYNARARKAQQGKSGFVKKAGLRSFGMPVDVKLSLPANVCCICSYV
jgi:hypothetical protein